MQLQMQAESQKFLTAYLSKALRSTMKKYWISFYLLAGLVQLAVWKDKLVSEIGVFPLIAVAI